LGIFAIYEVSFVDGNMDGKMVILKQQSWGNINHNEDIFMGYS
jgi:hypothetical protein